MYFNENKGNTNIDNEFGNTEKFDFSKYKKLIMIIGGILLLLIILIIVVAIFKNRKAYYITLAGEDNITIYRGVDFNDPGYRGYDNRNNDLTNVVETKSNLDSSSVGTYTRIYTLYNTSVTRTINVVERPETITAIHLTGDKNITISVGSEYSEPGYIAIDAIDGDLTANVTVSGSVDASTKGTYRITYSVVNSEGVTTTEVRIVTVE